MTIIVETEGAVSSGGYTARRVKIGRRGGIPKRRSIGGLRPGHGSKTRP